MMAETYQLEVIEEPKLLLTGVDSWKDGYFEDKHTAFLTALGMGAVRFATATFPEAPIDQIYAQLNERESEGRGPHFDVYNEGLSDDYPWLGVYNRFGTCKVSAAKLPEDMAEQYAGLYPEPNEAAHKARRHYGALVLGAETSRVGTGTLKPDMGLVLPQRPDGPHIIHEVVPEDSAQPGSFIKMIVPKNETDNLEMLGQEGFMLLDELLTQGIGTEKSGEVVSLPELPTSEQRRRITPNFSESARGSHGRGLLD